MDIYESLPATIASEYEEAPVREVLGDAAGFINSVKAIEGNNAPAIFPFSRTAYETQTAVKTAPPNRDAVAVAAAGDGDAYISKEMINELNILITDIISSRESVDVIDRLARMSLFSNTAYTTKLREGIVAYGQDPGNFNLATYVGNEVNNQCVAWLSDLCKKQIEDASIELVIKSDKYKDFLGRMLSKK